jgi:hypothetical protein
MRWSRCCCGRGCCGRVAASGGAPAAVRAAAAAAALHAAPAARGPLACSCRQCSLQRRGPAGGPHASARRPAPPPPSPPAAPDDVRHGRQAEVEAAQLQRRLQLNRGQLAVAVLVDCVKPLAAIGLSARRSVAAPRRQPGANRPWRGHDPCAPPARRTHLPQLLRQRLRHRACAAAASAGRAARGVRARGSYCRPRGAHRPRAPRRAAASAGLRRGAGAAYRGSGGLYGRA